MYKKLPDDLAMLYQEYLAIGTYALAAKYGVTEQAVRKRLKQAGYKLTKKYHRAAQPVLDDLKAKLSKEKLIELNQEYSITALAEMYNVSFSSIEKLFRVYNIKPKKYHWVMPSKLPPGEELLKLRKTKTAAEIAEMYGVKPITVYTKISRFRHQKAKEEK